LLGKATELLRCREMTRLPGTDIRSSLARRFDATAAFSAYSNDLGCGCYACRRYKASKHSI